MIQPSQRALLVIDLQNDYFPGGAFPQWNTDETLTRIEAAITKAQAVGTHVIHIQHIADQSRGIAPFFNKDSVGAQIHLRVLAAAPDAPVVIKTYADSFHHTNLDETLQQLGVTELVLCGMMTQNCVTHTAISKAADKYTVSILADCCTTVSEMIHRIALNAASIRVPLVNSTDIF